MSTSSWWSARSNSSNSNRLREIGAEMNVPSYLIDHADDVDPAWFDGVKTVGLTAGASAPEELVQQVIARLGGVRADRGAEPRGRRGERALQAAGDAVGRRRIAIRHGPQAAGARRERSAAAVDSDRPDVPNISRRGQSSVSPADPEGACRRLSDEAAPHAATSAIRSC